MSHRLTINQRSLLAITLSLVCFLGMAGWLLDQAFRDSAARGEQQRLESTLYGLLAVTDITGQGRLSIPNFLTDERFNRPNSGLYATITDSKDTVLWQSRSSAGKTFPKPGPQRVGNNLFRHSIPDGYFSYSAGIAWETDDTNALELTFHILSSPDFYRQQVSSFRQSLWIWFIVLALTVSVVQILVLKWSLSPLQQVSMDLNAVESGSKQQLTGDYPPELRGLTENLNHLLVSREQQLGRYRNALDDLAHSLKTPLAVLRGLDLKASEASKSIVNDQVERMTRIVDYHLQRAATAGQTRLRSNIRIKPVAERLANSLKKVYAHKQVHCEIDVADDLTTGIDENDLMELLGNLLDNACKWCRQNTRVSAFNDDRSLVIEVADDGPGIQAASGTELLQRGKRADQANDGQGIGLALVADITLAYQGNLGISKNEYGGATITLTFPLRDSVGKILP